ncbi:MAG: Ni/Fe-hydrogenase, b-type cytochrome subunit [Burkholderiaceae bacterium]|jgi:Ni/Fe-hydrogenase 1 B-type cytochrome subunit|nr:Ni/Fe-hydrogenase, b-type cytochrome subunit [Burkholderiaceae bacterium]
MSTTAVRKTYSYDSDAALQVQGKRVLSVYVYQEPVRLWHWLSALAIMVLGVTGYLIGKPLPTLSGEASAHFLMGYIRFAHFAAAYVFGLGLIWRIIWAVLGNAYARELFIVPVWDPQWWREFFFEVRWYLFLERYPRKYIGHNPAGQLAMFGFFVVSILMALSGFALYGEGLGQGSWASVGFGWMFSLAGGNSLALHNWHRLGMWAMTLFVLVHLYTAVREDIMSRQSMISTMVSGFRMFKH